MAYHVERLEKILEREISNILLNSKDERLGFVIITKVRLTSDMSIATIFYRIIGNEAQKDSTKKNLIDATGFIKTELSHKLEIRRIPELIFKPDESVEYGERIESIIKGFKK